MDVGWILMHFGWLLLVFGTIVMNFLECDWIVGPRRFSPAICIYIYIDIYVFIYIYIYISRMYTRLICLSFPTVSRMQVCIRFFRVYIYIYICMYHIFQAHLLAIHFGLILDRLGWILSCAGVKKPFFEAI